MGLPMASEPQIIKIIGYENVCGGHGEYSMTVHVLREGSPSSLWLMMTRQMLINLWNGIGDELTDEERDGIIR
jgi:hypothetical protein